MNTNPNIYQMRKEYKDIELRTKNREWLGSVAGGFLVGFFVLGLSGGFFGVIGAMLHNKVLTDLGDSLMTTGFCAIPLTILFALIAIIVSSKDTKRKKELINLSNRNFGSDEEEYDGRI